MVGGEVTWVEVLLDILVILVAEEGSYAVHDGGRDSNACFGDQYGYSCCGLDVAAAAALPLSVPSSAHVSGMVLHLLVPRREDDGRIAVEHNRLDSDVRR